MPWYGNRKKIAFAECICWCERIRCTMCNDHIICMHIDGVNSNGKWRMNLFGVFAQFHFAKYGTCRLHKLYNGNKYCMKNICTIFSIFLHIFLCVVCLFAIIPAASNETNARINITQWLWWWWRCWWRRRSQQRTKIAKKFLNGAERY